MLQSLATVLALTAAPGPIPANDEEPRGVIHHSPNTSPGYTLFNPFSQGITYLIDADGQVVHTWESRYEPGLVPYLLPNGNLLRGIQIDVPVKYKGGGKSGGLQEFSWDGELLWEFHFASDLFHHHHDIEPLPGGNILMIAWESRTRDEALAAGRRASHAGEDGVWPDMIVEIEPLRPYGARVVWEWHAWDHLIQDTDASLPHFGVVADHPERIDINGHIPREPADESGLSDAEQDALAALGYLDAGEDDDAGTNGSPLEGEGEERADDQLTKDERRQRERADWLHCNGVDYHAGLDQIVISNHQMCEIWIIDHSTTTAEAATSSGGRSGRGGDLLYRWGNPQTYNRGLAADRQLFYQHDPQWIPAGFPGAGNITVFNNGRRRPDEEYSTVVEIVPPLQPDGTYAREAGHAFGPAEPHWTYDPTGEERFFASFISGAHRLQNGNTLACEGPKGRLVEATPEGEVAWEYLNPFGKPEGDEPGDRSYGMFRATRIAPDHPGIQGRDLAPLDPQPKTLAELFAERPERGLEASGWQPLFDKDIGPSKWKMVNCDTFDLEPDPDQADELWLICPGEPRGFARSKQMYENFIVEFEARHTEEPGDGGFLLWADPLPVVGEPVPRGIEVRLSNRGNDATFTSHGDLGPVRGAAMTPDPRFRIAESHSLPQEEDFHANPTDEWNHYRITAIDGAVTLEVNGHLVTAGSACTPSKGYLGIESKGSEVQYRDMRIWELPAGSHAADAARTANEATEYHSLFSGLDLEDWEVVAGDWQAEGSRLTCTASPAELEAELPEGTTDLCFDYRRSAKLGNGLLPFRLGSLQFADPGAATGQWTRVRVTFADGKATIAMGERQQVLDLPDGEVPESLTLVNDGVATEFRNLFANGEE